MATIMLLNGPNMNLLGTREPEKYRSKTLADLTTELNDVTKKLGHKLISEQSNSESELIEHIHSAHRHKVDVMIFNPAAYTHTSIALRDAILAVNLPFIEVHLSNIFRREEYRKHSYFSDIALGVVSGFGEFSYVLALQACSQFIAHKEQQKAAAAAAASAKQTK